MWHFGSALNNHVYALKFYLCNILIIIKNTITEWISFQLLPLHHRAFEIDPPYHPLTYSMHNPTTIFCLSL